MKPSHLAQPTITRQMLLPVLLLLFLAAASFLTLISGKTGIIWRALAERQIIGSTMMFTLIPPYLLAMMAVLKQRTNDAVSTTIGISTDTQVQIVLARTAHFPPLGMPVIALFVLFGLVQNSGVITSLQAGEPYGAIDFLFILANALVWGTAGYLITWRIPVCLAVMRYASNLRLDLYQLQQIQPLVRLASTDVLVAAGAVMLMPLQSLDAQIRVENYLAGFIVCFLSGAAMFTIPLWGLRKNITASKANRLAQLQAEAATIDQADVQRLETHLAHIDRIRSISDWPINLRLVTRVIVYGVVPPMAWVAAALVENLIDSL